MLRSAMLLVVSLVLAPAAAEFTKPFPREVGRFPLPHAAFVEVHEGRSPVNISPTTSKNAYPGR